MAWKKLVGIGAGFVLVAALGFGYGVMRGVKQENTPLTYTPLPEQDRPTREKGMRSAIEAFYADPSEKTGQAAWDSIRAWRRTFPDADPQMLVEESAKIVCGDPRECQIKEHEALQRQAVRISEIVGKYAPTLPTYSKEFNQKLILDMALDRKIGIGAPIGTIENYLNAFGREQALADRRQRLLSDIDKAVTAFNVSKNPNSVNELIPGPGN